MEAHLLKPAGRVYRYNDSGGSYNDKLGRGLTLNSTYKLHYGSIEITMKIAGEGGVVNAFIVSISKLRLIFHNC